MKRLVYKPLAFITTLVFSLNFPGVFHTVKATAEEEDNRSPIIVVSMGDSYSSGEGIEPFYGQIDSNGKNLPRSSKIVNDDWIAHRSMYSWPSLLKVGDKAVRDHMMPLKEGSQAQWYNKSSYDSEMQWYFVAASGAVTWNFGGINDDGSWWGYYPHTTLTNVGSFMTPWFDEKHKDLDPQLKVFEDNNLYGKVDYVTMSIGGNDLDFVPIVTTSLGDTVTTDAVNGVVGWFNSFVSDTIKVPYMQSPGFIGKRIEETKDKWNNTWKNDKGEEQKPVKESLKYAYTHTLDVAGPQADIIVAGYPELYYRYANTATANEKQREIIDNFVVEMCDPVKGEIKKVIDSVNAELKSNRRIIRDKIHYVSVINEFKDKGMDAPGEQWIAGINILGSEKLDESLSGIMGYSSVHPNKTGAEHYAKLVNEKIEELEEIKKLENKNDIIIDDLKDKVELESNGTISEWAYYDYDGDGIKEAYAVIANGDQIQSIYFVDHKGNVTKVRRSFWGSEYQYNGIADKAVKGRRYFAVSTSNGGSGARGYIFGVVDGKPKEFLIGEEYSTYFIDENGFLKSEEYYHDNGLKSQEYLLEYDEEKRDLKATLVVVINPDNNSTVYLEDMPIIESNQYADNEGDSFVYKIGEHKNTRGNIGIDSVSYTHGLEAWIARWNYTAESSWAYSVFDLGGKYGSLSGKGVLIKSYNTNNFDTTLEFIGDGKIIKSYHLTPDSIPFDIEVNVSGVNQLKVYAYDNKAVSGGTSFGLTGMVLSKNVADTNDDNISIFTELPDNFTFTSGVGAWSTEITVKDDGTFTGNYHDTDMGDDGSDYPNGTVYICNFKGKFKDVKKVDEYTYSMKLDYITSDKTEGTIYYEDGVRYICSEPYGFDNADEFTVYLPGSDFTSMPEAFNTYISRTVRTTTPAGVYCIYNIAGDAGFFGCSDEDTIWSKEYKYTYEATYSTISASYGGYSHLTFWNSTNSPSSLHLPFKWENDDQRSFNASDSRGSGEYYISIDISDDLSMMTIEIESLEGADLSRFGGTKDGKLTATYVRN